MGDYFFLAVFFLAFVAVFVVLRTTFLAVAFFFCIGLPPFMGFPNNFLHVMNLFVLSIFFLIF